MHEHSTSSSFNWCLLLRFVSVCWAILYFVSQSHTVGLLMLATASLPVINLPHYYVTDWMHASTPCRLCCFDWLSTCIVCRVGWLWSNNVICRPDVSILIRLRVTTCFVCLCFVSVFAWVLLESHSSAPFSGRQCRRENVSQTILV